MVWSPPEIVSTRSNILYSWKSLPILPPALIGENFICEFFPSVKDSIVDMATFTTLAKILSLKNYYNTKIAGLGENFITQKFSAI